MQRRAALSNLFWGCGGAVLPWRGHAAGYAATSLAGHVLVWGPDGCCVASPDGTVQRLPDRLAGAPLPEHRAEHVRQALVESARLVAVRESGGELREAVRQFVYDKELARAMFSRTQQQGSLGEFGVEIGDKHDGELAVQSLDRAREVAAAYQG